MPIKLKAKRKKREINTKFREPKEVWEKVEKMDKEMHMWARKSDKQKEYYSKGYKEALQWVCQEQKEYKQ